MDSPVGERVQERVKWNFARQVGTVGGTVERALSIHHSDGEARLMCTK
jgi:hypothetical protein